MIIVMNRSKSGQNQKYNFTLKRLIIIDCDMNIICTSAKSLYTVSGFLIVQYCNVVGAHPGKHS